MYILLYRHRQQKEYQHHHKQIHISVQAPSWSLKVGSESNVVYCYYFNGKEGRKEGFCNMIAVLLKLENFSACFLVVSVLEAEAKHQF